MIIDIDSAVLKMTVAGRGKTARVHAILMRPSSQDEVGYAPAESVSFRFYKPEDLTALAEKLTELSKELETAKNRTD